MNQHDSTEQAYKRGYEDGKRDAVKHGEWDVKAVQRWTEVLKMANEKPYLTCKTVANPEKCENKNCKAWRKWFLKKWGELRGGK